MRPDRKAKPLYRKVNTRARGVHHHTGGDFRHQRNTKAERRRADDGVKHAGMKRGAQRGLDYTPLFRFLLSKIGQPWSAVHSEAVARLDREEAIWWMVARDGEDMQPAFASENAWFSRLFVDDEGILRKIDPDLTVEQMEPSCACCTHTFNGVPFTRPYVWPGDQDAD